MSPKKALTSPMENQRGTLAVLVMDVAFTGRHAAFAQGVPSCATLPSLAR